MKKEEPNKEILKIEEFTLDSPVSVIAPDGYKFCPNCGKYEHHSFRWCQNCSGIRLVRMKEMSIRTFLKITARHGSGPLNTLYCYLFGGWFKDNSLQPKWKLKLFEEGEKIYNECGGCHGSDDFHSPIRKSLEINSFIALKKWKEGKIK